MKDFYNHIQKLFVYRFDAFETCARSFPPASNNHAFDKSRINCDKIYHFSRCCKTKTRNSDSIKVAEKKQ